MTKKKQTEQKNNTMDPKRLKLFIGGLFMLFSLYSLVAIISFFFSWKADQYVLDLPFGEYFFNNDITVENQLGKLGAKLGNLLVFNFLGLGALIVPFWTFLIGYKALIGKKLLPFFKSVRYSFWSALVLSFFMGGLLGKSYPVFAGKGGLQLYLWSESMLGSFGAWALILACVLALLFLVFKLTSAQIIHFFSKKESSEEEEMLADEVFVDELDQREVEEDEDEDEEELTAGELSETEDSEDEVILPELEKRALSPDDLVIDFLEEEDAEGEVAEVTEKEEETPVAAETLEVKGDQSLDFDGFKVTMADDHDEKIENLSEELIEAQGEYDPIKDLPDYKRPGIELLEAYETGTLEVSRDELEANKNKIQETLGHYKIEIDNITATVGPTITLYEIKPAPGVRISKIKSLEDDIALSLAALGIRIIAPIPGKGTIGIEVPNQNPQMVPMRKLLSNEKFRSSDMELPLALGKTISNETFLFDLAKMPHLLMAGATGQGKSVGLNCILGSLLYKKHPSQIKFVLVDPKKVELTLFNKIERHFLAKLPDEEDAIITDTSKVVQTLNSLCVEMDDRYELLKEAQVRNIKEYNAKFVKRKLNPEQGHRYLPYIVLVVDEFADLIMTAGKEVETPIARLAQLARAIGIHLIIATQRPSVNVITGIIKANFPARIAFRVTSKIDSRTILDAGGAEQLIGRGDMLFSNGNDLIRLQCGFLDTPEVENICEFIGSQRAYPSALMLPEVEMNEGDGVSGALDDGKDALFEDAARLVVSTQQGSTSMIQRKFKVGYNRAGRIIDQLEAVGVVGPFEGSKARKVLINDEIHLENFLKDVK